METPTTAENHDEQQPDQEMSEDAMQSLSEFSKESMSEDMEVDDVSGTATAEIGDDLVAVLQLYNKLMNGELSPDVISLESALDRRCEKMDKAKSDMQGYRTATLWLQYMEMIGALSQFIKAERPGNWNLHLKAVQDMLSYFAAAGHNLYAKSSYIYLQQMLQLAQQHPDVHASFISGHHVIWRSACY